MKSLTRHLTLEIPARMDFVNITRDVERLVAESGIREGLCLVNAMHITASVFINDDEPGLHDDYKRWLEELAPHNPARYRHNRTGEDNGDAHHKRQIMGEKFRIPFVNLRQQKVTRAILNFLPHEVIRKLQILPLAVREDTLVVATMMPDPGPFCEVVHRYASARNVEFVLVQPSHLKNVIRVLFQQQGTE